MVEKIFIKKFFCKKQTLYVCRNNLKMDKEKIEAANISVKTLKKYQKKLKALCGGEYPKLLADKMQQATNDNLFHWGGKPFTTTTIYNCFNDIVKNQVVLANLLSFCKDIIIEKNGTIEEAIDKEETVEQEG